MPVAEADAELAAILGIIEARRIAESFPLFLRWCYVAGDDPHNPAPQLMEAWPAHLERAATWQAGDSEVILKARQLGFSWLIAAYMLWRAMFHAWAVGYYSRGEDEARHELGARVLYIWQRLPTWLRKPYKRVDTLVTFDGAGSIRVFPSTEAAGVGYTFQLVVADELAHHAYAEANYANYAPTLSAGGQFIGLSSANPSLGPHGFFHDLWWRADRGEVPYRAVFVRWDARPGRDEEWYEREAARAPSSELHQSQFPASPAEAFVGKSGLVFPMFDMRRHVRPSHPVSWADCRYRVAGVDFGGRGSNVTAVVPLGVYQDRGEWRIHQFVEFYRRGVVSEQDVAAWLTAIDGRGRFDAVWVDAGSGTTTVVASLRAMGVRCHEPVERDVAARNQWHAWVLEHDMLTLASGCTNGIAEYGGYRWVERTDPNSRTRYQTGTPVDHHADAIDARGYAIQGLLMKLLRQTERQPVAIEYVRKRPEQVDGMEELKRRIEARKKLVG